MEKVKILIADDHKLVRDGIKYTLSTYSNYYDFIEQIDEAVNGQEALNKANTFGYDVILMDINMPEMDGIKATTEIIRENRNAKIIALSMFNESFQIKSMIKAGASGYLLKNTGSEELVKAIQTVTKEGGRYFSNEVAIKLMEPFQDDMLTSKPTTNAHKKKNLISRREEEVLKLIANEYTNEEIAKKLSLSKRTIDSHRQNIINKIQAKNTAGLIRFAIKQGLLDD